MQSSAVRSFVCQAMVNENLVWLVQMWSQD
jgi:hypothetical protein